MLERKLDKILKVLNVSSGDFLDNNKLIDFPRLIVFLAKYKNRNIAIKVSDEITKLLIRSLGIGLNLSDSDLSSLDLSNFNFENAIFNRANLSSSNLSNANLICASFVCPITERTNLAKANFDQVYCHSSAFQVTNFNEMSFQGARDCTGGLYHGCSFKGASLRGSEFNGCLFYQCDFSGADLSVGDFEGCIFNESILKDVNFSGASLKNSTLLSTVIQNVDASAIIAENLHINRSPEFSSVIFHGARFSRC